MNPALKFIPWPLLAQAMPLDPGHHHVLHPAAPQASNIEWLYWVLFGILTALFVLMIGGLAWAGANTGVSASHPLVIIEDNEGAHRAGCGVGVAIGTTVT